MQPSPLDGNTVTCVGDQAIHFSDGDAAKGPIAVDGCVYFDITVACKVAIANGVVLRQNSPG